MCIFWRADEEEKRECYMMLLCRPQYVKCTLLIRRTSACSLSGAPSDIYDLYIYISIKGEGGRRARTGQGIGEGKQSWLRVNKSSVVILCIMFSRKSEIIFWMVCWFWVLPGSLGKYCHESHLWSAAELKVWSLWDAGSCRASCSILQLLLRAPLAVCSASMMGPLGSHCSSGTCVTQNVCKSLGTLSNDVF